MLVLGVRVGSGLSWRWLWLAACLAPSPGRAQVESKAHRMAWIVLELCPNRKEGVRAEAMAHWCCLNSGPRGGKWSVGDKLGQDSTGSSLLPSCIQSPPQNSENLPLASCRPAAASASHRRHASGMLESPMPPFPRLGLVVWGLAGPPHPPSAWLPSGSHGRLLGALCHLSPLGLLKNLIGRQRDTV